MLSPGVRWGDAVEADLDQTALDNIARLDIARDQKKKQLALDPDQALPETEDEMALTFSLRYADRFRYVKLWSYWLEWHGAAWRRVEDLRVFHLVRRIAREFAQIYSEKAFGKDATTAAVERMARNDPRHDRTPDIWNTETEAYGTPIEEMHTS
jgi:hypothetical protein